MSLARFAWLGVALSSMLVAGSRVGWAAPPRRTDKVVVTMTGSHCGHHLIGGVNGDLHRRDGKKPNADGIEWTFANDCGQDQWAVVCVYAKSGDPWPLDRHAFHQCDPQDRSISRPFRVSRGAVESVECRALKDGAYKKRVLTAGTTPQCPPSIPPDKREVHQLDVAIVP